MRSRSVRWPRPGGWWSASNPMPASCCASNGSDPLSPALRFRGRRYGGRHSSAQACRSKSGIAKTAGHRGRIRRRSGPAGSHARRRGSGIEFRQRAAGPEVDFGSDGVRMIGVDRPPRGYFGRSLAFGLGRGGSRLSIVSVMDDLRTTRARRDRADRRTTGTSGQSSDRRWCGRDGHLRGRQFRLRRSRLSSGICRGKRAVERPGRDASANRADQPRPWRAAILSTGPVWIVVHRQRRGGEPGRSVDLRSFFPLAQSC